MSGLPQAPLPTKWIFDAHLDPPAYTRPLVGSELSMQRYWNAFDADGPVCIGVNFSSSLNTEELIDRTRGALDKLRFVCPIIACNVENVVPPRWVYTPSGDREAWLNLAFVVENRGASLDASQFVDSMSPKRLPYADGNGTTTQFRVYLLTTSKDGEYGLYFHGPHTIIDAQPAFNALNLMFEWMSGGGLDVRIEPLEEWRNLPVDPVTATGGPSREWATAGVRLVQEVQELNSRRAPCHSLVPPSQPPDVTNPPFRYTMTMSESETAAIIAGTKNQGFSVSTLFYAAHCLAQFKMNPVPDTKTEVDFSSITSVSLERYMEPPVNPRTHFISSMTVLPIRFSMAGPLMERTEKARLISTTKIFQERFNRYLNNPCLRHLEVAMANMSTPGVGQSEAKQPLGEAEATDTVWPWYCAFNNVGVVEKKLQTRLDKITIESLTIGDRLRNFMTVHMWTMHAKFHFQVQGDMAWGEECIKTLLEETVRIGLLLLSQS